ncbi:MAG TPA: histidine phosphatase family protein, partial [Caulobacteraceae bacterium]
DKGGEARKAAETRSAAAALALAARAGEGRPVVVIAHGFFNHMIARELGRLGWTQTRNDGFAYWSQRIFEKR